MNIAAIVRELGLHPSKSRGQNFLVSTAPLKKMIDAAGLTATDTVIEIGPGLGVLTEELAKHAGRVIAVELEYRLVEYLKKKFSHVEIIEQNILTFLRDVASGRRILPAQYKIVANIPYHITGDLLRAFFELKHPPATIVIMVQKEVAERLTAKPGEMSALSVIAQYYADVHYIATVKAGSFWPRPKVASAIMQIVPQRAPGADDKKLFALVHAAFSAPRKQLANTLSKTGPLAHLGREAVAAVLVEAGVAPTARPEEVTVKQWVEIGRF